MEKVSSGQNGVGMGMKFETSTIIIDTCLKAELLAHAGGML